MDNNNKQNLKPDELTVPTLSFDRAELEKENGQRSRSVIKYVILGLFLVFFCITMYTTFVVINWCYFSGKPSVSISDNNNGSSDLLCALQYIDQNKLNALQLTGIIGMIIMVIIQFVEWLYNKGKESRQY